MCRRPGVKGKLCTGVRHWDAVIVQSTGLMVHGRHGQLLIRPSSWHNRAELAATCRHPSSCQATPSCIHQAFALDGSVTMAISLQTAHAAKAML